MHAWLPSLECAAFSTGLPFAYLALQRHYLTERIKGGAVLLYPLIEAMREHFVQPPVMSVEQWQNLVGGVKKALGGAAKVGRNSTGRGKRSEADWEAAREDATIKREQVCLGMNGLRWPGPESVQRTARVGYQPPTQTNKQTHLACLPAALQMPALQEVLANKKRKGEEGDE